MKTKRENSMWSRRNSRRVLQQIASSVLWMMALSSVCVVAEDRSRTPSPRFENPPLMYTGENLGQSMMPGHNLNDDDRGLPRMAQRTTELPIRLPNDNEVYEDYFYPAPGDEEEGDYAGPKLSAFKNGFFQKLSFSETWLPGGGSADDFRLHEMETFATFALPFPKRDWPLLITPYFNARLLDGPRSPDLPAQLYETYVDFIWVPKLTDRFTAIIAVAPSMYSDFQGNDADAFRLTGKGLGRYDIVPDKLQIMAGVLFLNRDDIRLLPAGGFLWKPNPDVNYEILFPKPKLSHRFRFGETWEDWFYLSGEFGGNSFAITRANGLHDKVTLRDWRAMIGYERKFDGGAGYRFEIGFVFNRSIEYLSGNTPDVTPDTTGMVRAIVTF